MSAGKDLAMGTEGLLGGRYRLDHVAGHGGMATVFAAHDTVLDRTVAIKLLQRRRDVTGVIHERFEREARAEAKIAHPNVVSVHDIGETEDGRPFIVMDYVEGRSLQEIIAEEAPLSSERVAIVGAGIARALAAAHALGIMHRDVKPANVIVDGQGIPHLMDFGLARDLEDDDPAITAPGVLVGTPFYVAPEQARHGTASSAADLYSLGAVLYHALTGQPPFSGDNAFDVALRRFEEDPPALRDLVPAADSELTALIHALLARDPVDRPWDAAAVAERLIDIGARLRATRTAG
ncbi:MAG: serine/threonine protein kinase [Candidatus Eremiobacteraeota bacterium]|nr:serine/threonine protein kinase [Candidatus Eremiobacteraeota bacterium]